MKYYVYLLLSNIAEKRLTYVGYTNDLKVRLRKHNSSKGAKFTKGRHWKLIYFREFTSKSEALKEEYKLKKNYKLRNKIKIKFLKNAKKI